MNNSKESSLGSFWANLWHGFLSVAFVLLLLGTGFSLGLIYWLLYHVRL